MPHLQAVETRRISPGLREERCSMCTVLERGLLGTTDRRYRQEYGA